MWTGVSIVDSVSQDDNLYSLEEINGFLDHTHGQSVDINYYFFDVKKF